MLTNEKKAAVLDMILETLSYELDMEQVCYCCYCHFWGTSGERTEGSPLYNDYIRQCLKYRQTKVWSDYCSDGVRPCRNSISEKKETL